MRSVYIDIVTSRFRSNMSIESIDVKLEIIIKLFSYFYSALLKDEINKLKKRIDELEQQLKTSNKINKDKEKTIEDLSKKLTNSLKQVCF